MLDLYNNNDDDMMMYDGPVVVVGVGGGGGKVRRRRSTVRTYDSGPAFLRKSKIHKTCSIARGSARLQR